MLTTARLGVNTKNRIRALRTEVGYNLSVVFFSEITKTKKSIPVIWEKNKKINKTERGRLADETRERNTAGWIEREKKKDFCSISDERRYFGIIFLRGFGLANDSWLWWCVYSWFVPKPQSPPHFLRHLIHQWLHHPPLSACCFNFLPLFCFVNDPKHHLCV